MATKTGWATPANSKSHFFRKGETKSVCGNVSYPADGVRWDAPGPELCKVCGDITTKPEKGV